MKHKLVITESQYEELLDILNEQLKPELRRKGTIELGWGDTQLIDNTKRTTTAKINTSSQGTVNTSIPENQWDSYIAENEQKLLKFFKRHDSLASIKRWNEAKKTEKKFAVAYLETFLSDDWEYATIGLSTEKIPDPQEPKTSGETYPGVIIGVPMPNEPSNDFFVNNEWILTDKFKTMFAERVIKTINDGKKQILAQNPKAKDGDTLIYLDSLNISTSCSTLPNGIPQNSPGAEKYKNGISFLQLSTERNNATREYVTTLLKQNGVTIDENSKIGQNPNGTNSGNLLGTSGPTWNSNLPDAQKRQLAPSYEQYKTTNVQLKLVFNNKVDPEDNTVTTPIPPKMIESKYFRGYFSKEEGHRGLELPGFKIRIPTYEWMTFKSYMKCDALSARKRRRYKKRMIRQKRRGR